MVKSIFIKESAPLDSFLARQPVLDRQLQVYGYELLFRDGPENFFREIDGDEATSSLIGDAIHLHSIERLSDGRRCFINFTRKALVDDLYTVLPSDSTVVELLETITPDDELISACRRAKSMGYELALDDYVLNPEFDSILPLIDILKVEYPALSAEQHQTVIDSSARYGFRLLAEKVETPAEYEQARSLGYHLFQGYFFCRPQLMRTRRLHVSGANSIQLLRLAGDPEFDVNRIEELIRGDLALSYKLLKYINSAAFQRQSPAHSVRQAVTTLGQKQLQRWVTLVTARELSGEKTPELINTFLIRARFCELIGEKCLNAKLQADCFLVGMFSSLDAILDQPMNLLVPDLSVSTAAAATLLRQPSPLLPLIELVVAIEQCCWEDITRCAHDLRLEEHAIFDVYQQSIEWAAEVQRSDV
jgi:c-di-GMP-related signal transduction protein